MKQLIRKVFPVFILRMIEKCYRRGRGLFWQIRYGFPARGMRVIAVTGTNGKTTTISYINEILKAAGYQTAALNTVFYEVGGRREPNKTHFTIDKQSIVQSFFAKARRAGVDFVVLEVTSHALDQDRIMGVKVEVAVITNLSQEHIDYHKTMENYARAKSLLLRDYGARYALLNADDEWTGYFKGRSKAPVITFGRKTADIVMSKIKITAKGSSMDLSYQGKVTGVNTVLPGEFNVYNAAAAGAVGLVLGIASQKIRQGIGNLKQVNGRMEEITEGQDFRVVVDFGLTPDAFSKTLTALRQTGNGKVRIVFGATGDRDKQKRPMLGRVAAELADSIYLTDDETYSEDPETIRQAVVEGIKKAKGEARTKIIPDRHQAIEQALNDAKQGDSVLISGLGHEDSRNMGGKLIPWSDQQTAQEILKNLSQSKNL